MPQNLAGTFYTATNPAGPGDQQRGVLMVPTSTTTMQLTLTGLDASNTVKTQKTTDNGNSWADQTTYSSDQASVAVTVAPGEQWRVITVAMQPMKNIAYRLSVES